MNEPTLQHWGIKGMRWGVRRYQNKDGTLTALGRKREKEMNAKLKSANKELKALKAENEVLKKQSNANSRSVSDFSDDELRRRINRLTMEKQYSDIYNQLNPPVKKEPSAGEKFVKKVFAENLAPALANVGKSYLEKSLKKALGLEEKPDPSKQLDFEMKKLDYASKKLDYDNKKNPKVDELADEVKRLENEFKRDEWKYKIANLGKDKTPVADIVKELTSMSQEDKDKLAEAAKIQENLNKVNKGN